MAQLDSGKTVDPFGEVNVFTEPDGRIRVKATILMRPHVEGAQTGLAIDGSNSMTQNFGVSGAVSSLFGASNNIVQPVARTMAKYLANFDSDGNTTTRTYIIAANKGVSFTLTGGTVGNGCGIITVKYVKSTGKVDAVGVKVLVYGEDV